MGTAFPTGIDAFPNPNSSDKLNNAVSLRKHSIQHSNINDAVEALERKVGVDGSADTSSLDYKVTQVQSVAAGAAATASAAQTTANNALAAAASAAPSQSTVYGLKAMNFDPGMWQGGGPVAASGQLALARIALPAGTYTNTYVIDYGGAGASITQAWSAIYDASGNLVAQSNANQNTGWNTGTIKGFPFNAVALATGIYYIGVWWVATTVPSLMRASNNSLFVNLLVPTNPRWALANAGLTTTAPASLAARSATANTFWVGAT